MTEDDERGAMRQDARAAESRLAQAMAEQTATLPDALAVETMARAVGRWIFERAAGDVAALRLHLAFAADYSNVVLLKDMIGTAQTEQAARAQQAAGVVAEAVHRSAEARGTRRFPIMAGAGRKGWLPWSLLAPHEDQAQRNHGGQSLERLAERGGLDWSEALAILQDRPWHYVLPDAARRAVLELHAATVNVEHVDQHFAAHEAAMAASMGATPLPAMRGVGEFDDEPSNILSTAPGTKVTERRP